LGDLNVATQLASDVAVLLVGAIGSAAAECLHWYGLRRRSRLPAYAQSSFYWSITGGMIVIGGFFAWLRYGAAGAPFDVFFTGLAAPIILQKLIAQAAHEKLGARGSGQNVRDFFVW
jgi:hypothetical protein